MNPLRLQMNNVVHSVLRTVADASSAGAPVGEIYRAVRKEVPVLRQLQSLLDCLAMAGCVRLDEDRYFATSRATELIASIVSSSESDDIAYM